ncbi:MAG: glycerate dehydrogenase [Mariniblastus sp.]|jgi:glycerate dehydrogenase
MRIVVLDGEMLNPGDNPWDAVSALGEMQVFARTSADETVERSLDADILLTNKVVLDADVLAKLPNLKFIAVTATGYNVVDVKAATARGIPVSNVPVYGTDSVAQHVMACILSFIHKPHEHYQAIQAGQWQASKSFSFWLSPLTELSGKTMGIVGLGKIGRATAKLAAAFGMKVIASSRTHVNPLDVDGFEWKSIEELFSIADFVSLHCPQTPETQGLVNASLLGAMKPTAVLINTARGGLINESDLADALNSDVLAAALLDVVSQEPIVDGNPLLNAKNCVLTPHIAWTTIEARRRLMQTTADNVAAFLAGSPQNLVAGN